MTLLEHYLPSYQFAERHSCDVHADAAAILDAVAAYRPEGDALFRVLIGLRELPMRLMPAGPRPRQFGLQDFTLLSRTGDELVYGLAGAFWKLDFGLHPIADGASFQALHAPGVAKLVLGFAVRPGAAPSRL